MPKVCFASCIILFTINFYYILLFGYVTVLLTRLRYNQYEGAHNNDVVNFSGIALILRSQRIDFVYLRADHQS